MFYRWDLATDAEAPVTRFNGFFVTLLSRRPIVKSEGQIDAPGFLGQDLPRRQLSERSQEIRAFDASYEQARDPGGSLNYAHGLANRYDS